MNGKSGLEKLRVFVGWAIVIAWIASLVIDAIIPDYEVAPTVHGLMLLMAGALFGPSITNRRRNGNGNGTAE